MMSWPVFGVPHFGRVHPWAECWALPPESSTIPVSANIQLISRWAGKFGFFSATREEREREREEKRREEKRRRKKEEKKKGKGKGEKETRMI